MARNLVIDADGHCYEPDTRACEMDAQGIRHARAESNDG